MHNSYSEFLPVTWSTFNFHQADNLLFLQFEFFDLSGPMQCREEPKREEITHINGMLLQEVENVFVEVHICKVERDR